MSLNKGLAKRILNFFEKGLDERQSFGSVKPSNNTMKTKVKFHGIDHFNRPIFKDINSKQFFGDTDNLFDGDATEAEVLSKISSKNLTYFGDFFGCEPMGTNCEVEVIYN